MNSISEELFIRFVLTVKERVQPFFETGQEQSLHTRSYKVGSLIVSLLDANNWSLAEIKLDGGTLVRRQTLREDSSFEVQNPQYESVLVDFIEEYCREANM